MYVHRLFFITISEPELPDLPAISATDLPIRPACPGTCGPAPDVRTAASTAAAAAAISGTKLLTEPNLKKAFIGIHSENSTFADESRKVATNSSLTS